jgi:hypothetical protein
MKALQEFNWRTEALGSALGPRADFDGSPKSSFHVCRGFSPSPFPRCRQFSLSQRERAGVRESTIELQVSIRTLSDLPNYLLQISAL